MTQLAVPIGTVIAGRYRIDRVLGAGSMGVVAAAYHLEFEQAVAIKFVNLDALGQAEAAERFRREVRAAAKIKGEHVARVLDVGALSNGLPYMVMELLDGRTLEEELEARLFLPVPEAVNYVLQAIEALAEAHAAGIVHRDLKPANLFISQRPDRSRIVKVLDFGVSKSLADSDSSLRLTQTGTMVGSPLYMSPEQLGAKTADVRSDVWALGAILFELLSGRTPYSANSMADLFAKLLRDPPSPLSRPEARIPAALEAVIMRCLQRDPEQRFSNVSDLAQALLPFAPARASVHAERARGVLFPSAPRQGEEPIAALYSPSKKTLSSWGLEVWTEQRSALLWGILSALLVVGLSFAILVLRVDGAAPTLTHATNRTVAASGAGALGVSGAALAPPSSLPAPLVEPVNASPNPGTEANLAPSPKRVTAPGRVAANLPRPVNPRPAAVVAAQSPTGNLSNFGGRK